MLHQSAAFEKASQKPLDNSAGAHLVRNIERVRVAITRNELKVTAAQNLILDYTAELKSLLDAATKLGIVVRADNSAVLPPPPN